MNHQEYIDFVEDTAIYPWKGESIVYPTLGLVGEAAEFVEAVMADDTTNIVKEAGDVMWYVVRCAEEAGLDTMHILDDAFVYAGGLFDGPNPVDIAANLPYKLQRATGTCAEIAKKWLRDSSWHGSEEEYRNQLAMTVCLVKEVVHYIAEDSFANVLQLNHDKIRSRVERGVQHGIGDDR